MELRMRKQTYARKPTHHLPLELELAPAAAFVFALVRIAIGAAFGTEQTPDINFGMSSTV